MPNTPEDRAREKIDRLLQLAGWRIFDRDNADIDTPGTMIRQFPVSGGGIADYAIYVSGKCAGVIEAKASGISLSGVESQAREYINSLPANIPAWARPLPFYYMSSGEEVMFYNGFSHAPPRRTFAFHTPEELLKILKAGEDGDFMQLAGNMPELIKDKLWSAQTEAICNLESSFA